MHQKHIKMNKIQLLFVVLFALMVVGCAKKKQSTNIIVEKTEAPKPSAPIRMQNYTQTRDVQWLNRDYQVEVKRVPDDSLQMVKDEIGQKFVDNRITIRVIRADGSVFFNRSFTKAAFEQFLDDDYRNTGILEGLVFDKTDGNHLVFAASVCHPQTDEYIPLVLKVSNLGAINITPDTQLDTNSGSNDANIRNTEEEEGV